MSSLMIPKNNLKFNIKLSISLDNLSLLKSIFSKCSPKIHILHFHILNRGIMIGLFLVPIITKNSIEEYSAKRC